MNNSARLLVVVLALGGASLMALAQPPAAAINRQADDVLKKDWKKLSAQGATLAKNHKLEDIMRLMKLRGAAGGGGVGVGGVPGLIRPDGIEAMIISLKRRPTVPAQDIPAMIRAAEITAAIASVAV